MYLRQYIYINLDSPFSWHSSAFDIFQDIKYSMKGQPETLTCTQAIYSCHPQNEQVDMSEFR